MLLTCGPLHLRQYLHPAAFRAKFQLAEHYNEYIDLSKEFNLCYGKGLNSSASSSVSTCSSLSSSATSSSAYASLSGNSAEANSTINQQFCYCCDYSFAYDPTFASYYSDPAAHLGSEQAQYLAQQQQEQMMQQKVLSGNETDAELLASQAITSSNRQQQQQQQQRHKTAPPNSGHMRQLDSMLKCK